MTSLVHSQAGSNENQVRSSRSYAKPTLARVQKESEMEIQITESQSMGSPVMEPLEGPEWRRLYRDALVELDMNMLQERLAAAEAAILLRRQGLPPAPDCLSERYAIEDALANLRILKRESLGLDDTTDQSPNRTAEKG
jgi:hypothetical protein